MRFTHKPFDALTLHELYELMCLREDVFVVGQKVTCEPEIDGLDPQCVHVIGRDDSGRIVATARLFVHEDPIKVGRVAVARDLQGQGIGSRLMVHVHEVLGERSAAMHAQAHLESWYTRMGWTAVGEGFVEAEIPHRHMVRQGIRR